jgi:hypothetical protein
MTKIYNAEQQQFIREARKEYCEFATEIDKQKQYTKELFEALVDKLGIDPKEDKESVKALKKGFALYYKDTKEEDQRVMDGAVTIAEL